MKRFLDALIQLGQPLLRADWLDSGRARFIRLLLVLNILFQRVTVFRCMRSPRMVRTLLFVVLLESDGLERLCWSC